MSVHKPSRLEKLRARLNLPPKLEKDKPDQRSRQKTGKVDEMAAEKRRPRLKIKCE